MLSSTIWGFTVFPSSFPRSVGHSPVFRVKVPASCGAAQSAVSAAPALVLQINNKTNNSNNWVVFLWFVQFYLVNWNEVAAAATTKTTTKAAFQAHACKHTHIHIHTHAAKWVLRLRLSGSIVSPDAERDPNRTHSWLPEQRSQQVALRERIGYVSLLLCSNVSLRYNGVL